MDPQKIDQVLITHAHPDHIGGLFDPGGDLIFPTAHYYVPQKEWDYWISADPSTVEAEALRHHLELLVREASLYMNTGEHQVLLDMGAGDWLAPRTGRLLHSMDAAGIDPGQIDTIIITHAHPDHVGGALDEAGHPLYAKAGYIMSKDEWHCWFSEVSTAKAPERFVHVARRNLEPIQDRVTLFEGTAEIVPGIRIIPAPGHTPGHMVVEVSSRKALLLYISDTVLHPLHLEHPAWLPIYDMEPELAAMSKHQIFDRAAAENALVMGQHFPPFPSLGTVVRNGTGWKWQPV